MNSGILYGATKATQFAYARIGVAVLITLAVIGLVVLINKIGDFNGR